MKTHIQFTPRGTGSSAPIVIVAVFVILVAFGVWMWIDMNNHHLDEKAAAFVEAKKKDEQSGQKFVPVPVHVPAPAPVKPNASAIISSPNTQAEAGIFECRWAANPIEIEGHSESGAWRDAPVIENFSQPWLTPTSAAKSKTRAQLLWDDTYLYFRAVMDDTDVYADIDMHNGELWNNDVFEMFFKPSTRMPGYYEFEISPLNKTFDCFFPSRGSGGYRRWLSVYKFHLETKVTMRGNSKLNEHSVPEKQADAGNHPAGEAGWIVEGRIPWSDFAPTGGKPKPNDVWRFALCRHDYSLGLEEHEMSTSAPLKQPNFHRYEDYSELQFKGAVQH